MNKISGWLNLYKPKGISSAKFISKIKYLVKPAKVGHAGTLDPLAEGVLPVAIGEATKLCGIMMDAKKIYGFKIQFGAKTSSGDAGTEIINYTEKKVSKAQIEAVIENFVGEISQVPSNYSAIKINGTRAYELARSGEEFSVPERRINIYDLKLTSIDEEKQQASFICMCSKGTYIRTLAEDLAFSLNNLGYVIELRRLGVGAFLEEKSLSLPEDFSGFTLDALKMALLPVDYVLDDILVINATEEDADRIRFGQQVYFPNNKDGFYAVFSGGNLCAIGQIISGTFKIKRVFNI